jgi:uncharacterized protein YabN with tetrapyrrole methylase and pyrophosphatase domain
LTQDALYWIRHSEKVLYAVADPVCEHLIREMSPNAESLAGLYSTSKPRWQTYAEMVECILGAVRWGASVCAVFYGHPGVFVRPSHEAVWRARREGFWAEMLPGISAEDCLFADLGLDPAREGCQTFEATDFLLFNRQFDPCSSLVLWQIGCVGELGLPEHGFNARNLAILIEVLERTYTPEHEVVVYEAASLPIAEPLIQRVPLHALSQARIGLLSTLYVPPRSAPTLSREMAARLNLDPSLFIAPVAR